MIPISFDSTRWWLFERSAFHYLITSRNSHRFLSLVEYFSLSLPHSHSHSHSLSLYLPLYLSHSLLSIAYLSNTSALGPALTHCHWSAAMRATICVLDCRAVTGLPDVKTDQRKLKLSVGSVPRHVKTIASYPRTVCTSSALVFDVPSNAASAMNELVKNGTLWLTKMLGRIKWGGYSIRLSRKLPVHE